MTKDLKQFQDWFKKRHPTNWDLIGTKGHWYKMLKETWMAARKKK